MDHPWDRELPYMSPQQLRENRNIFWSSCPEGPVWEELRKALQRTSDKEFKEHCKKIGICQVHVDKEDHQIVCRDEQGNAYHIPMYVVEDPKSFGIPVTIRNLKPFALVDECKDCTPLSFRVRLSNGTDLSFSDYDEQSIMRTVKEDVSGRTHIPFEDLKVIFRGKMVEDSVPLFYILNDNDLLQIMIMSPSN